ncbi:hypothetical protein CEXT_33511 [Caerostris extrusa]|uniref:Uncharacterized protein n=1 Tax=Caerostris extrusa TaxID=172846 RepID=A0AAV4PRX4_CAEEX|nr:hypothetical protein CEXT_33511 [Caerostris extrusa]
MESSEPHFTTPFDEWRLSIKDPPGKICFSRLSSQKTLELFNSYCYCAVFSSFPTRHCNQGKNGGVIQTHFNPFTSEILNDGYIKGLETPTTPSFERFPPRS